MSLRPGELEVGFRALTLDGVVMFDVATPAGGYEIVSLDEPGVTWRRDTVTSPFVDGSVETGSTRDAVQVTLAVRVLGASTQQVNVRRAALTDACSGPPWWLAEILVGNTVTTWRANRADWTASTDRNELTAAPRRRLVTLTIPVQPSRGVSYR